MRSSSVRYTQYIWVYIKKSIGTNTEKLCWDVYREVLVLCILKRSSRMFIEKF